MAVLNISNLVDNLQKTYYIFIHVKPNHTRFKIHFYINGNYIEKCPSMYDLPYILSNIPNTLKVININTSISHYSCYIDYSKIDNINDDNIVLYYHQKHTYMHTIHLNRNLIQEITILNRELKLQQFFESLN